MATLQIKGAIISNDDKWIYDWFEYDATCPRDVNNFIDKLNGEELIVEINSGGGDIFAASEIYTKIRGYKGKTVLRNVGLAASAASVILSAAYSEITPTGMVMLHNTQGSSSGDYRDLDKGSEILQKANQTIRNAYQIKTKLSDEELEEIMNNETWLTAQEAVNLGLCDKIMDDNSSSTASNMLIKNTAPSIFNSTTILDRKTIEKMKKMALVDENPLKGVPIKNNVPASEKVPEQGHFFNKNEGKEDKKEMDESAKITNVQELEAAYPELVDSIKATAVKDAVEGERSRMQEIDEIAATIPAEIVSKAKYEEPVTASVLALQAIKATKEAGANIFNSMVKSIEDSGANEIAGEAGAGTSEEKKTAESKEKVTGLTASLAKAMGRRK